MVGFGEAGDAVEGVLRGAGEDGFAGALHRQTSVGVLDEGEMGGDVGFEREAAQERLAEGVDGADAHPAGEVEHAGEQGAGLVAVLGADAEVDEGAVEGGVRR